MIKDISISKKVTDECELKYLHVTHSAEELCKETAKLRCSPIVVFLKGVDEFTYIGYLDQTYDDNGETVIRLRDKSHQGVVYDIPVEEIDYWFYQR